MKAYRIYHINENGEKIYSCESPGYWAHHCADPEYAVPYLERDKAESYAKFAEKYVSPAGARHVEKYEETRPLVRYMFDDQHIRLAQFMPYFTDRCCYKPVTNPA